MHAYRFSLLSSSLALALVSAVPAAHAQGANKELLDVLLGNGAITQKQYNQMIGKVEAEEEAKEKEPQVTLDQRGFRVRSADDSYSIKVGGRLHAQGAMHLNDDQFSTVDPTDGTELRRARIEMSGTIQEDWRWAAEADFANNGARILDWWLSYQGWDDVAITAGHQKQPYSLSLEMSSNDIAYIERSIDNALVVPFVDRAIGLRLDTNGTNWFFAGGLFGESVGPTDDGNPDGNEGWGAVGRFIYAPVITDHSIVHLGVRGAHRLPADNRQEVRIRDETHNFSNLRIVDTGAIQNVDSTTLFGPEIGLSYGPFTLLGEYNVAQFDRENGSTLEFTSWHVGFNWLFGAAPYAKSYKIDSGEFKRPVPLQDFSWANGGWGAFELAARYASIDLNDGDVVGGTEDAATFAANWYINNNVRLMFDWTHIVDTDGSNVVREEAKGVDILQTRAQWTY